MKEEQKGLIAFQFDNHPARVIMDEGGNPWWVAADVCAILGIANPRDAISALDDDEKGVEKADTLGGKQSMNVVNESGLYALIFRSNKPEAKTFRKWITAEVLPAIRKTGGYASGQSVLLSAYELMLRHNKAVEGIKAAAYVSDQKLDKFIWLRLQGLTQEEAGRAIGIELNYVQIIERRLREQGGFLPNIPSATKKKMIKEASINFWLSAVTGRLPQEVAHV